MTIDDVRRLLGGLQPLERSSSHETREPGIWRAVSNEQLEPTTLLRHVLKAIGVSEVELRTLASSLLASRRLNLPVTEADAAPGQSLQSLFAALEQDGTLLTEDTLVEPQRVASTLPSMASQLRVSRERLNAEIEATLREAASEAPQQLVSPLDQRLPEPPDPESENRLTDAGDLDRDLVRVISLLTTIGDPSSGSSRDARDRPEDLSNLRQLLTRQLESVRLLEQQIRRALRETEQHSGIDLLLNTIERFIPRPGEENPLALQFHEFAAQLAKNIRQALRGETPEESIRKLLEAALREIHERFSEQHSGSPSQLFPDTSLPRPEQNMLRSLFHQSLALLPALVEGDAAGSMGGEVRLSSALISSVQHEIRQAIHALAGERHQLAREQLNDLSQALAQHEFPSAEAPSSTETILRHARAALDALSRLELDSTQSSVTAASNAIEQLLEMMQSLEQEMAPSALSGRGGSTDHAPFAHERSSPLRLDARIRALLNTHGASDLLEPLQRLLDSTPVDTRLAQLVEQLLTDLDGASRGKEESGAQHSLRRGLDALRRHIEHRQSTDQRADLQKKLDTLRGVEGVLRSSEMLVQMSPILRAAGEPILLLFPALISGLLFAIEVQLFPEHSVTDTPGEKDDETSGNRKPFQRLKLRLQLPGLGPVRVDLLHREGESLLRFKLADEQRAEFLRQRADKLQHVLHEQGYNRLQISFDAETPLSDQPIAPKGYRKNDAVVA